MNKPLRALARDAVVIDLDKIPGIQHFSVRDHHEHHYHKHHGHGQARDPHIWLHTDNAAAMVKVIAGILSGKDLKTVPFMPVTQPAHRSVSVPLRWK